MKYRPIPIVSDVRCLPKHINLLRNLQDMHHSLISLPETFPVLELGDIIPNYEERLPKLISRGKKILVQYDINPKGWEQKIEINLSVYGMAAHQLVARKKALANKLEQLIERWQILVDKIENPKDLKCCCCGNKLSGKWILSSHGSFCSNKCAEKGTTKSGPNRR